MTRPDPIYRVINVIITVAGLALAYYAGAHHWLDWPR